MNGKHVSHAPFQFRIVVRFSDRSDPLYTDQQSISEFFLQETIIPWKELLASFPGIAINKLFTSVTPANILKLVRRACKSDPAYQPPSFLSYFVITCPGDLAAEKLVRTLCAYKNVQLAYIQSLMVCPPAVRSSGSLHLTQGYLDAAPYGIDARYAWGISGGDGRGEVKFIDIEQGWIKRHEAIVVNTFRNTGINQYVFEDHGAAVLGVIMMRNNTRGAKGITPLANGYIISQWRPDGNFNNADAIMAAVSRLDAGDILLLEAQTFTDPGSHQSWPLEVQEANYQAIRLATAAGVIVIEAAGNGNTEAPAGNDLDKFTSHGQKTLNPQSPGFLDSGAILVAAASSRLPHTRLPYSNFGSRINCYAWGEGVVTAGSYPGSSGFSINRYTGQFNGTSSAAAIITGAAIAIQSIAANRGSRLNPLQMRTILSNESLNTLSANGHAIDKIGVMPDLKKIITRALSNGAGRRV